MAELIFARQEWIHRRVESMHFEASGQTRRRVSIDTSVPDAFRQVGYMPIALLEKRVLSAFDASDASGRSLPVWTRGQNGRFAIRLLLSTLASAPSLRHRDLATEIVSFDPGEAGDDAQRRADVLVSAFASEVEPTYAEDLHALGFKLCFGFLLVVSLPDTALEEGRTIVKFSYEEPVNTKGWLNPLPISTSVDLDWGRGFHFEAKPPEGVAVRSIEAGRVVFGEDGSEGAEIYEMKTYSASAHVGHILLNRDRHPMVEYVDVTLAATKRGLPTVALSAVLATLALLVVGAIFLDPRWSWIHQPSSDGGGTTSALLLLGPALVATFLSRGPEHSISARQLRGARVALALSVMLLFAGAALAAKMLVPDLTSRLWGLLVILAIALACWYLNWWKKHTV